MSGEAFALAREEQIRTLTAYSGTTTADGSSSKNTLIDSALIGKNDFLTGKSVLIMSGDAQYETAGITSFNSTTGEITVGDAFSAQIMAGVSFRLLNTLPESIHITSGQVQIMGYDYESGEWRKVRVTGSGEVAIHVTVADIVTAKISGETVIAKVSGEVVNAYIMSGAVQVVSGEIHVVSGQVVAKVSGETVIAKISGETVIAKVSGEAVKVSGQTVIAKISGETLISKVSGEVVIGKISGETVQTLTPNEIRAGYTQITSLSGGTELSSGVVVSAKVKNISGNAVMWLGPPGVLSGTGFLMHGDEADEFEIGNLNAIYLYAETSGQYVTYRGVATP